MRLAVLLCLLSVPALTQDYSGTVTVRACGFVSLVAAPAGTYRLVLAGPAN